MNTPDPFEERSRELFDNNVERLDAQTRSRLNQARQRALTEINKGSARRYWLGAPLGGLAAAALIALIMIRPGAEAPSTENASVLLDDFDIVADADNFELIQDIEFYSWLATQGDSAG
ncbi:hypothetical protein [Steroidobacter agaridevorans]|uniref:hypothetical protein n=1 Tax=Steroidobacter agaridevorans TaxID=2695856 RepID=UPI00132B23C5|nr:hypothetical protein [Steroidobacter agaridevorans]GFE89367.1 hypothetical protein GCM10011488_43210 [Steroidobacter agaridevorans]